MKNLRPLRTEADYEAALLEVEHLWGAKSGTPRGDRLDVLATLIDVYETEHHLRWTQGAAPFTTAEVAGG
jgi:HTH-type transcriptional regulator/antitoxin HigA